jgi:IclR family acetate operon transcriptional repressor
MSNNVATSPIRSVQKALKLFEAIGGHERDLGLTELARELGFPKSVTYKLLSTLTAERFLKRDPLSRRYSIGPAILTLAGAFLNANPLTRECGDVLRRLSWKTGQTASLSVLDSGTVLYVATCEGRLAVKTTAAVGDRRPLHATATGKVLLSDLPEAEVDRLLGPGPLPRFTERTIVDVGTLREVLQQIRRTGIAYNRREYAEAVAAVAAAVYDHRGRVAAGLSVGIPAAVQEIQVLDALAPVVAQHAAELSARLGAAPATSPYRCSPGDGSQGTQALAASR